jgi:hypothetical protein
MPMSVIILDGKTMVEVENVLMELEEAVDFITRGASLKRVSPAPQVQSEPEGGGTGLERYS